MCERDRSQNLSKFHDHVIIFNTNKLLAHIKYHYDTNVTFQCCIYSNMCSHLNMRCILINFLARKTSWKSKWWKWQVGSREVNQSHKLIVSVDFSTTYNVTFSHDLMHLGQYQVWLHHKKQVCLLCCSLLKHEKNMLQRKWCHTMYVKILRTLISIWL